jgi:hypothetical protein
MNSAWAIFSLGPERPARPRGQNGPRSVHVSGTSGRSAGGHRVPTLEWSVPARQRRPDGGVDKVSTHGARVTRLAWWRRLGLTRAAWHRRGSGGGDEQQRSRVAVAPDSWWWLR